MNKISRYILCFVAVLSISACESVERATFDTFHPDSKFEQSSQARSSSGVTPLPNAPSKALDVSSSSNSVEVFDMELNPDYQRGTAPSMGVSPVQQSALAPRMHQAPMSGYGQGIRTGDSSVTVYNLDGDAMPYPPFQNNGNSYEQSYGSAEGQIFFKHGSSRLGGGDIRKLSSLADQAKFAPVNYITVSGYASRPTEAGTNSVQAHIINLRQSIKRAEKVSKALMRKGVPGDKIKTVGWSTAKATGDNRQDRRVDVVMGEK